MRRNKLYLLLFSLCLIGYFWVGISYNQTVQRGTETVDICLFKQVTGLPCPSCGATHSVLYLLQGNIEEAVFINPLGILLFFSMILLPIWLAYDFLKNKNGLFNFYKKTESLLRQKQWAVPAIALIMANWIWNIYKGL